jgi:hypothetical protein
MKTPMNELTYYESKISKDLSLAAAGAKKQKVKEVLKLMATLADLMEDEGMYLFCGGCNDHAVLCSDHGGVILGIQHTPVWMGGDFNQKTKGGVDYEASNVRAGEFHTESH